jgi:hypothetical protein
VDRKTAMNVIRSGGENSPPEDLPDTITGRDGKQYPATKLSPTPWITATGDYFSGNKNAPP